MFFTGCGVTEYDYANIANCMLASQDMLGLTADAEQASAVAFKLSPLQGACPQIVGM